MSAPGEDRLSPWTLLAWISALSGPLAYALGRVVVETFYGRFDVLPGEIGLGYDSLVAPALLVVFATAVVGVVLILLGRLALAIGGIGVGSAIIWFLQESGWSSWQGWAWLGGGILALGILAALGTLEETYGYRLWTIFIVLLASAAAVMSLVSATNAADDAAAGRPVSLTFLGLPITAIRATPVQVSGLPASVPGPGTGCVLLLGSSDGVTVLLDRGVVWRVPADVTTITSGC